MLNKNIIYLLLVAAVFNAGCASKQPSCSLKGECGSAEDVIIVSQPNDVKNPAFPYKPIIGTRNNDAKTVVDTGVVLKVYIATYKDSKKTLVAAHDRYVWAKEPGFIVGAERPEIRKRTGMITPAGKVPFAFGAGEIDSATINTNNGIKQYNDKISTSIKDDTEAMSNLIKGDTKFNDAIKNYLKNKEQK